MNLLDEHDRAVDPRSKDGRKMGMGRHTMGIILLMCVVFLWTASNFLASVGFSYFLYPHALFEAC